MDDKLKRELSAAVDRGADDPKVKKLLANDAQARAYFNGLLAVDRALREWPAPSERDSDAFVDAVLARLDEPLKSDDFDPFAAPFADEREATKNPRQHTEQHEMSQSNDQDNEDDLEGLAALMRPSRTGSSASVPPPAAVSVRPGPALADDAMDESSGIVDIKHLAAIAKRASVPPAAEEAPKAEAKGEDKSSEVKADKAEAKGTKSEKGEKGEKSDAKASDKKSDAKGTKSEKGDKAEKSEAKASEKKSTQAVPAASAAAEPVSEKKGASPVIWIAGIGLAAGIAFVAGRQGNNNTASVNAEAPQSAAPAQSPVMTSGTPGAAHGATPSAQPSGAAPTQPPAVTQPAAADPQPASPAAQPVPTESANQPAPNAPTGAVAAVGGSAIAAPSANNAPAQLAQNAAPAAANSAAESEGSGASERRAAASPTRTREAAPSGSAATSTGAATTPTTSTSTTTARSGAASDQSAAAAPRGSSGAASSGGGAATGSSTTASAGATAPTRALSVQELMDRATGRDRQQAQVAAQQNAAASQAAALPAQLTRSMVQSTMSPFNSQVRACAQGQTGTATAILTVNGDGSVSNAVVSSPWGSGPNDCITNRLRSARFPAVQRPSSRVVYPFSVLAPQPGG